VLPTVVALALAGCGDDADPAADWPGAVPWSLASGLDVRGWESAAPAATFGDGRVAGSTGCNRFEAPYTRDGDSLEIGSIASTLIGCEPSAQAVERAFVAALERVGGWRLAGGGDLVLDDGDGRELLRFQKPSLSGSWTLTALLTGDAVTGPKPGTELTATFAGAGTLSGSAGCNRYEAAYEVDGGAIEIRPPRSEEKACSAPAGVMDQERAYLAALPLAASYRIEGGKLSLLTAAGTFVATYERRR
jgi:heat shock protein HslJ